MNPTAGESPEMCDESILRILRRFTDERNWDRFHTPENLAKSVSIEAAELLECFQWGQDVDWADVQDELADVLTYAYLLAEKLDLDPQGIVLEKLKKTAIKYPSSISRSEVR